MYDAQEFHDYLRLFELENWAPDWVLFKNPEATELLRNRAASYGGLISISHFIRAFGELRAEGKIRQVRNPLPPEPLEPELTVEMYRSMPAASIVRKYQSDPDFKLGVDGLIQKGLI
jgi:hypothetical protein